MFGIRSDNNSDSDSDSNSTSSSSDQEDSQSGSSSNSSSSIDLDDEKQWTESIDRLYQMLLQGVLQREGHAQIGGSSKFHANNFCVTNSTRFRSTAA